MYFHKPPLSRNAIAMREEFAVPVLMYHQVARPAEYGSPYRYLTVAPENFARQMKWLKRLGFQGLSVGELAPYFSGCKVGKVVGITFDDGFRNVYEHALPALQAVGFTATNYFVSRQVGGHNAWDESIGIPYSPCMNETEIREWASLGHEVGAHTVDHVRLTQVDRTTARQQISASRKRLEDIAGRAVTSFSYPYGDVSWATRELVREAGFATATTTKRGRVRRNDDPLLLPRRIIRTADGWISLLRKCMTG